MPSKKKAPLFLRLIDGKREWKRFESIGEIIEIKCFYRFKEDHFDISDFPN